jgi:hypothetical protein
VCDRRTRQPFWLGFKRMVQIPPSFHSKIKILRLAGRGICPQKSAAQSLTAILRGFAPQFTFELLLVLKTKKPQAGSLGLGENPSFSQRHDRRSTEHL